MPSLTIDLLAFSMLSVNSVDLDLIYSPTSLSFLMNCCYCSWKLRTWYLWSFYSLAGTALVLDNPSYLSIACLFSLIRLDVSFNDLVIYVLNDLLSFFVPMVPTIFSIYPKFCLIFLNFASIWEICYLRASFYTNGSSKSFWLLLPVFGLVLGPPTA